MRNVFFLLICLMHSSWSSPVSFLVKSPTQRRLIKRQVSSADDIRITNMTVTSQIQFRYSRTIVESLVKNFGDTSRTAKFELVLPNAAFISNFSMISEDVEYIADVKPKDDAKKVFNNLADKGHDVGLIEKKSRDANVFQIQTNVAPASKVVFKLTYDELLERRFGSYEHAIHVQPGQIVDTFSIVVNINESLPITKLNVPKFINSNELDFSEDENTNSIAKITREVDGDPSKAKIIFDINREYQKTFGPNGIQGEFLVKYDVDRNNQSHEVQVIDGHFVHFFTPENLKTLPKHMIFVLDVSGSMFGEKIEQLKDAMFTILDEMADEDQFDIITFSSDVQHWKPSKVNTSLAFRASKENKKRAIKKILNLQAAGGTNIDDALQIAISVASKARKQELVSSGSTTMILFMTDGEPTEGVTDKDDILTEIKKKNSVLQVPIFSLAFGADAQFDLIMDIAKATDAHAKQIYEGSDAALQLEGFYQEISSPLLSNLKFNYLGSAIDQASLSNVELKTFFRGNEFIVCGKIRPGSNSTFDIKVEGVAGSEMFKEDISVCAQETSVEPSDSIIFPSRPCYMPQQQTRSEAQIFLKNLYAFLNIKQLLEKDDKESRDTALEMSMENHFVTDLTSLVVVKNSSITESFLRPASATSNVPSSLFHVPTSALGASHSQIDYEYEDYDYFTPDLNDYHYHYNFSSTRPTTTTPTTTTTTTYVFGNSTIMYDFTKRPNTTVITTTTTTRIPTTTIFTATAADRCQLTLFSKTYHRGDKGEILQSTPDLLDFKDRSVSAKLEGPCSWALYSDINFKGELVVLRPGGSAYTSVTSLGDLLRRVKSVKKVN